MTDAEINEKKKRGLCMQRLQQQDTERSRVPGAQVYPVAFSTDVKQLLLER